MLAGSLTFLASLYMWWVTASQPAVTGPRSGVSGLLDLLNSSAGLDGWGVFGQVAAVAAVALALLAVIALLRPELEAALPIGGFAIALAALALVNDSDLWTQGLYRAGLDGLATHVGYGAYVGGAAALAALLSAAWVSRDDISEPRNAALATLLTVGLVGSYVLPIFSLHTPRLKGSGGFQFVGVGGYGTAVMLLKIGRAHV